MNESRCPLCGKTYSGYAAISRTNNTMKICPECGTQEAITQFQIVNAPTYYTQNVAEWVRNTPDALEHILHCLDRHMRLDWGEMDAEDKALNNISLVSGDRIFSAYDIPKDLQDAYPLGDNKIWIITEADRSATTILFPDEY